ncbi:hypothetical protein QJS10_CPB11g02265 [Acorus calamus]|uniref:Bulb-type lectin domain-containing protein n=1 Tax=Acorus calamus TaxID=4465 RepID=A0AAV9DU24_ACOCL|nr:hypothetical protein QJS10_CPB11g02265 [Acorus calamus]
MQTDCNLVLYDNNRAIWSSGTYNRASGCFLKMQRDGNLVIYSNRGAVWASGTNVGNGNYVLVLQRDRNVVIYGSSLWATATNLYGIGVTINPLKKNSTA